MSCVADAHRPLQEDRRRVVDRLNADGNPGRQDDSYLNAVGAVWAYQVEKSAGGYAASSGDRAASGFLIDRCHVLTNMHVVFDDPVVVDPPMPHPVAFGVGQTESDRDRGALQGLKFLLGGAVVAHGHAHILDGSVLDPAEDWAVVRLASRVDATIVPLPIAAVDSRLLHRHFAVTSAGYPSDHRSRRGDGFKLKDLWQSAGEVVAVDADGSVGALVETTLQTTPGNSGGPIFGDVAGREHVVIGMVQGLRGNGIDVSEAAPNVQLLFTTRILADIGAALTKYPCH